MNSPVFSIIMPNFNGEKYISVAIKSVLKQTFISYELIIVDDLSTDKSIDVINKYLDNYSDKIKLIQLGRNQGSAAARNIGLQAATGEFIAFIDSDDFWSKYKLEKQLNLLENHTDVGFIYSGYYMVNEKGEITQRCLPDESMKGNIYEKLWLKENSIWGGTMVVCKDKLVEIGFFDDKLRSAENFDLRVRLSSLGSVYYNSDLLAYYRRHSGSQTGKLRGFDPYYHKVLEKHFGIDGRNNINLYKLALSKNIHKNAMYKYGEYEYGAAIRLYLKSIYYNPKLIEAYIGIIRCLLGKNVNAMLSLIKNKFINKSPNE